MIGVSIADSSEWKAILNYYNIDNSQCKVFPFGEYFTIGLYDENLLFYSCDIRKVKSSASTQYMIDHFDLKKIIVVKGSMKPWHTEDGILVIGLLDFLLDQHSLEK